MWSYLKTVMIDFPSRLLAAARGRRGCATTGLGMRFTLERIALRSGAEHVGGVHRVEIFLDRLNLAVTHHEEKVIEVLVGLAVFHLGIRFGLDRDPLALGCYAFGGEPETTVNLEASAPPPFPRIAPSSLSPKGRNCQPPTRSRNRPARRMPPRRCRRSYFRRSSLPAQLQARENEQKTLALWLKGATFEQVAAAGFGITTASGAWRAVRRALVRIPKKEADEAREAQLARLQALRLLLWNHAASDPIKRLRR